MSFRKVIRTWRHIIALTGTASLEYWACSATAGGVRNPQCDEFENVPSPSSFPLYYPSLVSFRCELRFAFAYDLLLSLCINLLAC
jgi:hypothetical protein